MGMKAELRPAVSLDDVDDVELLYGPLEAIGAEFPPDDAELLIGYGKSPEASRITAAGVKVLQEEKRARCRLAAKGKLGALAQDARSFLKTGLSLPENLWSALAAKSATEETTTQDQVAELRWLVNSLFPGLWPKVEAALSTVAILRIADNSLPFVLVFQGDPAGEKTLPISLLPEGDDGPVLLVDDFTPRSFVSHIANVTESALAEIDLLPKLNGRTLAVPELAPILGARHEDLVKNLSTLTRVLDGQGYKSWTGARGYRGKEYGNVLFTMIGATTPLPFRTWSVMANLGTKIYFYSVEGKDRKAGDLMKGLGEARPHSEKVALGRRLVTTVLENLWSEPPVDWDKEKDEVKARERIALLAKLVARTRGAIRVHRGEFEEEAYQWTQPIVEDPSRAVFCLYNLARGRAILYGRANITLEDLPLVMHVALSSAPWDRGQAVQLLIKNKGEIQAEDLESPLGVSRPTALRTMKTLALLGVGHYKEAKQEWDDNPKSPGRPPASLTLAEDLHPILAWADAPEESLTPKTKQKRLPKEEQDSSPLSS